MPEPRRWEDIETSSEFRQLDETAQRQVRADWWYSMAPMVYGPQLQDPELGPYLYNRVVNGPHIPYVHGEEEIITPETLTGLEGYRELHVNQTFSRLPYKEQQELKDIWFSRLLATNPEVQSMSQEELSEFHQRLMERVPSYGSRFHGWVHSSEEQSGLLLPFRTTEDYDVEGEWREERPYQHWLGMRLFNTLHGAVYGAGSLIIGPVNFLAETIAGPDNEISQLFDDLQKEHAWVNLRHAPDSTVGQLMTQAIPQLTGYIAGIMLGPYSGFENLLAGKTVQSGMRAYVQPGRIQQLVQGEQATRGLVSAVNAPHTLAYQVAGGAVAGAIQGITDAMMRGEPWWKNIPLDATFGVGLELVTRGIGSHMMFKQMTRNVENARGNILLQELINSADEDGLLRITPELESRLNGNPQIRALLTGIMATDENRMLQRFIKSEQGLDFQADLLGYEVRRAPDGSRYDVYDTDDGSLVYAADRGNAEAKIVQINDFFAESPKRLDMWARHFEDRTLIENIMTSPEEMTLRIGDLVPTQSRATILTYLENHGIELGASAARPRQFIFDQLELSRPNPPDVRIQEQTQEMLDFSSPRPVIEAHADKFNLLPEATAFPKSTVGDITTYTDPETGITVGYRVGPKLDGEYRVHFGVVEDGQIFPVDAVLHANKEIATKESRAALYEMLNSVRESANSGEGLRLMDYGTGTALVGRNNKGQLYLYAARATDNKMQAYTFRNGEFARELDDVADVYEHARRKGVELNVLPGFREGVSEAEQAAILREMGINADASGKPVVTMAPKELPVTGESLPIKTRPKSDSVVKVDPEMRGVPHQVFEEIDRVYHLITKGKTPKITAQRLAQMGVIFDENLKRNYAAIAQLRKILLSEVPGHPVIYANVKAGEVLNTSQVPRAYLESDFIHEPQLVGQVVVGTPSHIREILKNIDKAQINAKIQRARTANGLDATIIEHPRDTVVELQFSVPTKNGMTPATLYFPSVEAARLALEEARYYHPKTGKAAAGYFKIPMLIEQPPEVWARWLDKGPDSKLPKTMKIHNDSLLRSYMSWAEEARRPNARKGTVPEFLPFTYAARMANQRGFNLGVYNGVYVIQQPGIGGANTVRRTFNNLEDTLNWLGTQNRARAVPDLMPAIHPTAMAEVVDGPLPDPMEGELPYLQARALRDFGFFDWVRMYIAPAQYNIRHLENLKSTQQLYDLGHSLGIRFNYTEMWNTLLDSQRVQRNFIATREAQLKQLMSGVNHRQSTMISEYIEALDEQITGVGNELEYLDATRMNQRTRAMIYEQMRVEFSPEKADELVSKAAALENYYDEMFSLAGINFNRFIRHYIPHIREDVATGHIGISYTIHRNRFGTMPDVEKETFIQLLREGDPREVALQTDALKLAETYTHLVARMIYTRPTLQRMGNVFRMLDTEIRAKNSLIVNDEWKFHSRYFAEIINTLEGVRLETDEAFAYATTRSLEKIAEVLNKKMGTDIKFLRKIDPVGRLTSMAMGAHLGARPFPIFRNLTQSVVFSPVYGTRWWYRGLDRVLNDPGALARIEELGIAVGHNVVPTGIGQQPGAVINASLSGYKWSDLVNRGITYYAVEARVNDALRRYRAGTIDTKKFVGEAGLRLFGRGNYNEMARAVNTMDGETLARWLPDRMGRLAVDHTQYLYDRFAQPQLFRSGIGRFAGTYTSWPNNFFSFMKNAAVSDSMTMGERAQVLGGIVLVSSAIAQVLHESGIDGTRFMPLNMGMMSAGPYYQLIQDLVDAANGDMNAWRGAGRAISSFIPFVYEYEGIMKSLQAFQEGEVWEGIMHVMSAPVRYDLYPRRKAPVTDDFEDWWNSIGEKYLAFKQGGNERLERRSETIRDFRELFQ